MCIKRIDVSFDPEAGPIFIDIGAGFATQGKYVGSIRLDDAWLTFGRGDVADEIPDLLVVPHDGHSLHGRRVLLAGKYAPADLTRGRQIKVHYEIKQGEELLAREEIEEEKDGVILCSHTFTFLSS
jgi:hypothetical protein